MACQTPSCRGLHVGEAGCHGSVHGSQAADTVIMFDTDWNPQASMGASVATHFKHHLHLKVDN